MGKLLSIVIHSTYMKIAELSRGRKGIKIHRLVLKKIPEGLVQDGIIRDEQALAGLLSNTIEYESIRTKRVIFSLPSEKIMTREIVLPQMSEEKLKMAIKVNASEYFPIDLSSYVLSHFIISKIEEKSKTENKKETKKKRHGKLRAQLRLMIVAAPNEIVQSYYNTARFAGLKVESVDYIGNGTIHLTDGQIGDETCLAVQVNEEDTVLTIYNKNIMVLQRHIGYGSLAVAQAVMETEQCSYEDAVQQLREHSLIHNEFDGDEITESLFYLLSNIRRMMEYYSGKHGEIPLEQIYMMGNGACIVGLGDLLEHELGIPVKIVTSLKQVQKNAEIPMCQVLNYMDNIGAAMNPVHFIPRKLEQDIRKQLEIKSYRVIMLLTLFISLVIITVPATEYFAESIETLDLQNKLVAMQDVKLLLEQYRTSSLKREDMEEVQKRVKTNDKSLLTFIEIFEQLRPSKLSIEEFSCVQGQVQISALAENKKTVAKLIQQLNTISNISEVKVSGLSSVFENGQETVSFSLTCHLINERSFLESQASEENEERKEDKEEYDKKKLEKEDFAEIDGVEE